MFRSARAAVNAPSPAAFVDLHRTVLIGATEPADLHLFLNRAALIQLRSSLRLPPELRRGWKKRFR